MMRSWRLGSGDEGAGLVEFGVTLPIVLALIVGLVDSARAFQAYIALGDSVRQAAREAAVHGSGSLFNTANVTLAVGATGSDFALSTSPTRQGVNAGQSAVYTVTITPSGGFSGSVTLSVAGIPAGSTATFSPQPATTSSTLTVATAASTPTGSYVFTLTGVSGTLSRQIGVVLVITPTAAPDFTLDAAPVRQAVTAPGSASFTTTITRSAGFTAAVQLVVGGLPPGTTGSFTPNPVTGSTSTLTVTTSGTTAAGTYQLTISGDGGSGQQQWGPAANDSRVVDSVRQHASGLVATDVSVTSSWPAANNSAGSEVIVGATYTFRPLLSSFFGGVAVPMSASSRARIYR